MNYYFHVPFCRKKCAYCAFYSEPSLELWAEYLKRLEFQLRTRPLPEAETIYFGGGTPTLPAEEELEKLFSTVLKYIPVNAQTEISCEGNPETITPGKTAILKRYVTRFSMGVQSFHENLRKTLGRDTSDEAIRKAVKLLQKAQFPHFNIDLIYAIAGQPPEAWKADLTQALDCGIDHLSCYNLTAEENSALGAKTPVDETQVLEMESLTGELSKQYGFSRYEISNRSRPGCECRHNVNVWRGGLLTGFGPAAASFDGKVRTIEVESVTGWLRGDAPFRDEITPSARRNEIFAVNLRTAAGWTKSLWEQVPDSDDWETRLTIARNALKHFPDDCFIVDAERFALSSKGLLFWNEIAEALL